MRIDKRKNDQLRNIRIKKNYIKYAEGSVLICFGDTKVICNASVEDKVPSFLEGSGKGWITAEYSMLPRATHKRKTRDIKSLKKDSRSTEIQRLIGRSLRSVVNLSKIGERTITLDCDVIQADGGTRTAAITGGFIALSMAIGKLLENDLIIENPIESFLAAVSGGIVDGEVLLDLNYLEDSSAQVDINIIMNERGEIVEIQGTGEKNPFKREELDKLLDMAWKGVKELIDMQVEALVINNE